MTRNRKFASLMLGGLATALLASSAAAQIERFVIRGAAERTILETNMINIETAARLAKTCAQWAREHGGGASIVILDQYGNLAYFYRTDGQSKINIDTAIMKARSVVNTRVSTHETANRMRQGQTTELRQYSFGNYPVSGAIPIMVGNQMIGVMGVGGGAGGGDEACAYYAATTVVGPQPPLAPTLPPDPAPAPGGRGG